MPLILRHLREISCQPQIAVAPQKQLIAEVWPRGDLLGVLASQPRWAVAALTLRAHTQQSAPLVPLFLYGWQVILTLSVERGNWSFFLAWSFHCLRCHNFSSPCMLASSAAMLLWFSEFSCLNTECLNKWLVLLLRVVKQAEVELSCRGAGQTGPPHTVPAPQQRPSPLGSAGHECPLQSLDK